MKMMFKRERMGLVPKVLLHIIALSSLSLFIAACLIIWNLKKTLSGLLLPPGVIEKIVNENIFTITCISVLLIFFFILVFFRFIRCKILLPIGELKDSTESISRGNLDYRIETETVACWKIQACEKRDCPAYENLDIPCWYIAGTMCEEGVSGEHAKKIKDCHLCDVYQQYSGDELCCLADSFNVMATHLKLSLEKERVFAEHEKKRAEELQILYEKLIEKTEALEKAKLELEAWSKTLEEKVEERTGEVMTKSIELERTVSELKEVNRELDSFVYTASHDLKEPLRGIESFSKFLLADCWDKIDDQGKNYLQRISGGANRMKNLIDDLLTLSRITRTKRPYVSIDAREMARESAKRLESIIEERGVVLKIQEDLPMIYGDEVKLTEVFYNLISNAIKYNDKEKPMIEIDALVPQPKDEAIIWVKDNGIGIDTRYYEEIFKIFKRLHTQQEYGGGTGAGLAIVKRIIEEHNGRIWVESELGKGSKFYISLPKAVK
ncbi:GHKL domain-containing protein [bacterium]|nr:GHKL domain-containing protein [bacterium]